MSPLSTGVNINISPLTPGKPQAILVFHHTKHWVTLADQTPTGHNHHHLHHHSSRKPSIVELLSSPPPLPNNDHDEIHSFSLSRNASFLRELLPINPLRRLVQCWVHPIIIPPPSLVLTGLKSHFVWTYRIKQTSLHKLAVFGPTSFWSFSLSQFDFHSSVSLPEWLSRLSKLSYFWLFRLEYLLVACYEQNLN